jgi:RNA polymerase sigma factor (sigma-70 family)
VGESGACATSNKGAQELLVEFQQTGSQQPFEELARRYAGMVYNVALRVTRDAHDAEDATQATFLTLAVHAKTAGKIRYVGPWLKKVSHRLALDIRRSKKRRRAREERVANNNGHNGNGNGRNGDTLPASHGLHAEELRHILREEIDKLPAKYRMPLILYYFGGLSPDEMSKELRCNTSTLGVRLHRGRKMLADSLTERGITMNAAVVAAVLGGMVETFVKDNIVHSASQVAGHVSAHGMVASHALSMDVLNLMQVAKRAIAWSKLKGIIAVIVLIATSLTGAGEVLNRYDLLNPELLQKLNPLRLIKPLMERFSAPQIQLDMQLGMTEAPEASPLPLGEISEFPISGVDLALAQPLPPMTSLPGGSDSPAAPRVAPVRTAPTGSFVADARNVYSLKQQPGQPLYIPANPPPPTLTAPLASVGASAAAPSASSASSAVHSYSKPLIIDGAVATGERFLFNEPAARMPRLTVGDSTVGQFIHQQGALEVDDGVVIGNRPHSRGTYAMDSGSLKTPSIVIGKQGDGTFTQSGGTVTSKGPVGPSNVVIGSDAGSSGRFLLNGGEFDFDSVIVGREGRGELSQNGGTISGAITQVGQLPGGVGTVHLNGGDFNLTPVSDPAVYDAVFGSSASPAPPPSPVVIVGGQGNGTLIASNSGHSVAIGEKPGAKGSSLVVRSAASGDGTLRGYGTLALSGSITQNARVIADGFGVQRVLDLSAASKVTNTIENPSDGSNGWYARNGGSLKLPTINVSSGRFYNWGEEAFDSQIDLVNSVRFRTSLVRSSSAKVNIELLDATSGAAPALPDGERAVGLWSLSSTADATDIDLIVRYDDAAVTSFSAADADVELWVYEGKWMEVADSSFGIDPADHLLWGTAGGLPSFFAATVDGAAPAAAPSSTLPIPEPSTFGLLALSAGALFLRRRHRC